MKTERDLSHGDVKEIYKKEVSFSHRSSIFRALHISAGGKMEQEFGGGKKSDPGMKKAREGAVRNCH